MGGLVDGGRVVGGLVDGARVMGGVIITQSPFKKLQKVIGVNVGGSEGYVMGCVACGGFIVVDLGEDCRYLTVIKEFQ